MKLKMLILIMILLAAYILVSCSPASATVPANSASNTIPAKTDTAISLTFDADGDGMISVVELKSAYAQMREMLKQIEKTQPDIAAKFEADIESCENMDPYKLDLQKVMSTAQEIMSAVQAAKQ